MNRFKIEIVEAEENKSDTIIDVQCDVHFLAANLSRAIYEITRTVEENAHGAFKCKNGFWLLVCDIVNTRLEDEAGVKW